MAAKHGKGGKIKISSNTVADLGEWTLDIGRDTSDVTSFGDADLPWKTFLAGLAGATAKLTGRLNMGDTTGQLAMFNSLTSDTPLTFSLQTETTPHQFTFDAFVSKFGPKTNVADPEMLDVDLQVTGDVAYA